MDDSAGDALGCSSERIGDGVMSGIEVASSSQCRVGKFRGDRAAGEYLIDDVVFSSILIYLWENA